MSFSPKPIEDYLENFFSAVSVSNPAVTDRSIGSGLYTLGRGFSALSADQDLRLLDLSKSVRLSEASGSSLDIIAADFNLRRRPAQFSRGHALLRLPSEAKQLNAGVIFVHAQTGQQFLLEREAAVYSIGETAVPIRAMQLGPDSNLEPGTRLICPDHVSIIASVGRFRDSEGIAQQALSGGASAESDDAFRQRISTGILQRRGGTEDAVVNAAMSFSSIVYAEVEVISPGVVRLWLDAPFDLSEQSLSSLKENLMTVRPLGVTLLVQQLKRQVISLRLEFPPAVSTSSVDIRRETSRYTEEFFRALKRSEDFEPDKLATFLNSKLGTNLVVASPQSSVFVDSDAIARFDSLSFVFN